MTASEQRYVFREFSFRIDHLCNINPHTPVAKKVADEVVYRRFQGEGVEFFKSDFTDPPQIFDAHLFENTNLSPSRIYFSVGFYIKIMF